MGLDVFVGRITYVKVEIGYAFLYFAAFGGFTIESSPDDGTLLISAAADLIPRRPGSAHLPDLFWIAANCRWFLSAYATST